MDHELNIEAEKIAKAIVGGDIRMLSKAITLVESTKTSHQALAAKILTHCLPHSGKSFRIGITGVPGVGKSTLINALGTYLITEKSKKIAVLAIDPSSTISKGSILGDKTRMPELNNLDEAFIRPTPTSNSLGGVAAQTRESIILCEAAGFDTILIETVGVGQSETKVYNMVDAFVLLLLPSAGDELQGIKRGIVELADFLVVNKADGVFVDKARETAKQYSLALSLMPSHRANIKPEVLLCSAETKFQIDHLWMRLEHYLQKITSDKLLEGIRKQQDLDWFEEFYKTLFLERLESKSSFLDRKAQLIGKISKKQISPTRAAFDLLEGLFREID